MTSGTLPTWLERWLGVDSNAVGDATRWRFEHSWPWPPWVTLLAVVALIAAVLWHYGREARSLGRGRRGLLVGLRLALLVVLLLMIAEVSLALHRTGLPYVTLLVDDSQSMNVADQYVDAKLREAANSLAQRLVTPTSAAEPPVRFELVKSLLTRDQGAMIRALAVPYRLKCYWIGEQARPITGTVDELREQFLSAEARGASSRLGECLRDVLADLRGSPPAAAILLTDGVTTDGEPLSAVANVAWRKGVPLFIVGVGSDSPVRDAVIEDLLVDEEVFVDDTVDFHAKLRGVGLAGRQIEVQLRESTTDEPLAKTTVTFREDGRLEDVHLPYRPTVEGEFDYEVVVEPIADELTLANNRMARHVVVRKEQIRVLLADGYPRFEYRYLKNLLERDATINLQTFLQSADADFADEDRTAIRVFPVRREELFHHDVVILGDVSPSGLSNVSLAALRELVEEHGGGLALVAGEQYNPLSYQQSSLAPLFPVDLQSSQYAQHDPERREGFNLQPTELGLATPFLKLADNTTASLDAWRRLPPLYWFVEAPAKPSAQVLAEHRLRTLGDGQKAPLITLQYAGAGKVVFHAVDETWRWRYRVGDAYFARYWIQLIRYLSRAKLLGHDRGVEFTVDRREYARGESVRLRVRFLDERRSPQADDGVAIVIEEPSGRSQSVVLQRQVAYRGLFEGQVNDLREGLHHARLAAPAIIGRTPSADFLVTPPPGEMATIPMAANELRQAASETHGRFYRITEVDRLLADLPPGRQAPIEALPPIPLWNRWWMLMAFLMLLCSEWLLRKRWGMI